MQMQDINGGSRQPARFGAARFTGGADPLHGEADHRIANNLTLIIGLVHMRARSVAERGGVMDADEVCLLLEDIVSRVETVARLHRMLSQSYRDALVDLGSYLRDLCASLAASLSADTQIVFRAEPEGTCMLPPEQVLNLGLVMGELVTNSVKYAHPTGLPVKIEIGCRRTSAGMLAIDFSDDGIGLPENFNPKTDGSIGLRVVHSLAAQLGAVIDIGSSDLGLRFRLEMPVGAGARRRHKAASGFRIRSDARVPGMTIEK